MFEFGVLKRLSDLAESGVAGEVDGVSVSPRMAGQIVSLVGRLSGPRQEDLGLMNMPALLEELRAVLSGSDPDVGRSQG